MSLQIFRTKQVAAHDIHSKGLNRCLSAWDLAFLGVGAIIGTGIFVLTGIAAATQSGPAVILSFVIAGLACAFAALSYAELASSVGGCGSAYGYSYAAFGELIAFIIGWDLLLEYGISVAAVANGWSGYFNNALTAIGFGLPDVLTKAPKLGGYINLPAFAIILILMGVLIMGVKHSAKVNNAMVVVKLITISIFIGIAVFNVHPDNWHPFMPFGWFQTLPDGKTTGVPEKKPDGTWEGLSPGQQKILAPLESDWDFMLPESRKKWILVANLYPKISEVDQVRLQSRMTGWSNLSQRDRRIARENYLSSLKFPAEKKAEAWSAYQKLSDEEKKRLAQAEENKKKPTAANAPTMQQHAVNPTPTSQLPPRVPKGITPSEPVPSATSSSGNPDSAASSY